MSSTAPPAGVKHVFHERNTLLRNAETPETTEAGCGPTDFTSVLFIFDSLGLSQYVEILQNITEINVN